MKQVDVIRTLYSAFAAGDAAAILETFAEDVEFRLAEGHPYRGSAGAWIGKEAVATNFFAVAGPEWQGWSIGVEKTIEAADAVVVEGRYTGLYKPTGRTMDVQVCHVWRFRDGKIASFHQYVDTARLQGVMGR
jgi:ketosteroid isomerase-like protein